MVNLSFVDIELVAKALKHVRYNFYQSYKLKKKILKFFKIFNRKYHLLIHVFFLQNDIIVNLQHTRTNSNGYLFQINQFWILFFKISDKKIQKVIYNRKVNKNVSLRIWNFKYIFIDFATPNYIIKWFIKLDLMLIGQTLVKQIGFRICPF